MPTRTADGDCNNIGSLFTQACNSMASAAAATLGQPEGQSKPGDQVNDIDNGVAKSPTVRLHIPDFFSLSALAVCEGILSADGSSTLTGCCAYFPNSMSPITQLLVSTPIPRLTPVTPLANTSTISSLFSAALNPYPGSTNGNIPLSGLGLTPALESTLDGLTTLLKAVAVLLSIGIGFTGLSLLSSIPTITLSSDSLRKAYTWGVWTNLVFVSSALFFLILGGLVVLAGAKVAEGKVNDLGRDAGVSAIAGKNWPMLAWVGIALMAVVLLYWVGRVVRLRRRARQNGNDGQEKEEEGVQMRSQLPQFARPTGTRRADAS